MSFYGADRRPDGSERELARPLKGRRSQESEDHMTYVPPNREGSIVQFRSRYQNFIGGDWVKPVKEQYFENVSPVNGKAFCEVARSTAEDVEKALDAAHGAKAAWGKASPAHRASVLL